MLISENLIIECDRAVRTARCGNIRLGLDMARRAYRQARAEGAPAGLLLALNALAICQSTNGSYIEAVATAIDAFRLATKLEDSQGAAHALTTLAGASNYILDTAEIAMKMLDLCLARGVTLEDKSLEVRVRNARGINMGLLKRFDEADLEFKQALALIDQSDGTTPPSLIVGNIAHFDVMRATAADAASRPKLLAAADDRVDEALECALRERSEGAEVRVYFNRGLLSMQLGEYESALASFEQSLELAERLNLKSRIIDTHVELGAAHVALGHYDDAVVAYDAAYKEGDSQRPTKQLTTACERLAVVYDLMGFTRESAHSRAIAEHERIEFERESQHVRDELTSFWREIEKKLVS